MIEEGYDPEMIRKIDDLANTQAQTGKGMAINEPLYHFRDQWVCKLDQTGANTNVKGKRKGIFWRKGERQQICKNIIFIYNQIIEGLLKASHVGDSASS
eukprot:9912375-Karenia_brevis.AAC.1